MIEDIRKPNNWWCKRRKRYNFSLIAAGVLAFIFYASIVSLHQDYFNQAEVTLFTTMVQGVGYLIMMGIANICYYLGPISEKLIKPKDLMRYRKVSYGLGYWFSVSLPFSIPGFLLYTVFLRQGIT